MLNNNEGNCSNIVITKDNGSKTIIDYEATTYNWYLEDIDSSKVELPDLTGFTLIEE